MRGKKAKVLKKVIRNQINKIKVEGTDNLFKTKYEPVSFTKKNFVTFEDKEPKLLEVDVINTRKLEFCFRRAYQSLKSTLKNAKAIKYVKKS